MKRTKQTPPIITSPSLTLQRKHLGLLGLFSIGIILRYVVMSLGYNFDFESFCIVGEIAGNFRNVYAETYRYNYGPIFFCIQGLLYKVSQIKPDYWLLILRVLTVTVLTLADLGITAFIASRYSWKKALIFFLNPVSIIITGYHNQFDNIAVLLALLSTIFFNEDEKFNKKDIGFVVLFSISLVTKHILFLLPVFILLMKNLPVKKKILYAFVPPVIFLLSFVPFAVSSPEAMQGIINNVFKYRSFNNAPLIQHLYQLVNFPEELRLYVYILMMISASFFLRKYKFEKIMLIYLIAMVAFSSAITQQYLIIPMAALCILDVGNWDKIYIFATGLDIVLGHLWGGRAFPGGGSLFRLWQMYSRVSYTIAAWILFFALIHVFRKAKLGAHHENL